MEKVLYPNLTTACVEALKHGTTEHLPIKSAFTNNSQLKEYFSLSLFYDRLSTLITLVGQIFADVNECRANSSVMRTCKSDVIVRRLGHAQKIGPIKSLIIQIK